MCPPQEGRRRQCRCPSFFGVRLCWRPFGASQPTLLTPPHSSSTAREWGDVGDVLTTPTPKCGPILDWPFECGGKRTFVGGQPTAAGHVDKMPSALAHRRCSSHSPILQGAAWAGSWFTCQPLTSLLRPAWAPMGNVGLTLWRCCMGSGTIPLMKNREGW